MVPQGAAALPSLSDSGLYKGSCVQCRAAKIRCDHRAPCARCVKMGLDCIPNEKGRGRPKGRKSPGKELASRSTRPGHHRHNHHHHHNSHHYHNDHHFVTRGLPSSAFRIIPPGVVQEVPRFDHHQQYHSNQGGERGKKAHGLLRSDDYPLYYVGPSNSKRPHPSYSNGPDDDNPSSSPKKQCSHTSNKHTTASSSNAMMSSREHTTISPRSRQADTSDDMYKRSACFLMLTEFTRLLRDDSMDKTKALCSMKLQAMRLVRFGREDYTKMVLDTQASLMGMKDWYEAMSVEDRNYAEAFTLGGETRTSDFQRAKKEIESILQPHAENAIAHSYSINIRGEPMTYCNKRYREMFLEDDSELEAFNIKRLYAPLLWGKAMCPGDHATFFAAIMQASCTTGSQATDHTMVVQCLRNDGSSFLGQVRVRSFFFASAGMGYSFSVEEFPTDNTAPDSSRWSTPTDDLLNEPPLHGQPLPGASLIQHQDQDTRLAITSSSSSAPPSVSASPQRPRSASAQSPSRQQHVAAPSTSGTQLSAPPFSSRDGRDSAENPDPLEVLAGASLHRHSQDDDAWSFRPSPDIFERDDHNSQSDHSVAPPPPPGGGGATAAGLGGTISIRIQQPRSSQAALLSSSPGLLTGNSGDDSANGRKTLARSASSPSIKTTIQTICLY